MLFQRNENLFGFTGFHGKRREEKKMRGCRRKAGSMISIKQLQFSSSAYGLSPCDESSLRAFLLPTIDNQELSIRQLADLIFSYPSYDHNYPYKGLCIPWEKASNRRTRNKRLILFRSQINQSFWVFCSLSITVCVCVHAMCAHAQAHACVFHIRRWSHSL